MRSPCYKPIIFDFWAYPSETQKFSSPNNILPSINTIAAATTNTSNSLVWRAYLQSDDSLQVENFNNPNLTYRIPKFANSTLENQLKMVYSPSTNSYLIVAFSGEVFSVARIVEKSGIGVIFEYLNPVEFKFKVGFGDLGGWFIQEDDFYIWYTVEDTEKNRVYLTRFEFVWPSGG